MQHKRPDLKLFFEIINNDKSLIERVCNTSGEFTSNLIKNPRADINLIFKNQITGRPYIPGSSIKGAIRTAILEDLRKKHKFDTKYYNNHKNREEYIKSTDYELKIIEGKENARQNVINDPFKFLKVSDFEVNDDETYFGTARIINKNGEGKGIPVYTEMTNAYCFSSKEITATGTISIDDKCYLNGKLYKALFEIENIINQLNAFYNSITSTEKHNNCINIEEFINNDYNEGDALIRLGRYTQIESKTFKIKRTNEMNFKGRSIPEDINVNGGLSRTLINNEIPAGWAILRLLDKKNINIEKKIINIKQDFHRNKEYKRNENVIKENQIYSVEITGAKEFGLFVKNKNRRGFIHKNEIPNDMKPIVNKYKIGEIIEAVYINTTEKGDNYSINKVLFNKYLI